MEKAYDVKDLGDKLKDKGLEMAEDAAMVVVECVLEWVEESAKKSENTYDDLMLAVLPLMKPEIMKLVDKIDKKEG